MQKVKLFKKPRLVNPVLVTAWPGMGEVALRSVSYLVEHLKAEDFAYLNSSNYFYPTASMIKNGILSIKELPQNYFYYWKNPNIKSAALKDKTSDLIFFLSNAQPDLNKAEDYADAILEVARLYKVQTIISFAAKPAPIDHTQTPGVWYSATSKELSRYLEKFKIKMLVEGEISGMNGLFLSLAKKSGFSGFCLLGDIPIYTIQIENPKAVLEILIKLKEILNIPIDLKNLEKQIEVMEGEINKLVDYLKEGMGIAPVSAGQGPISDAEIERIRKSLTQLSQLPKSIKEKIEELFEMANKDIAKANELKSLLDKWSVYKEYEDRFLDLFKGMKDRDN